MKPSGHRSSDTVSARFSRLMCATTSPLGVLTDPPLVGLATAVLFVVFLVGLRLGAPPGVARALAAVAALPTALGALTWLSLLSARKKVITRLDALPFAFENANALLNGVGDALDVTFDQSMPDTAELNRRLDEVHPDSFVLERRDDERLIRVKIGVVDSKRNPARSSHLRWQRALRLAEQVFQPMEAEHPIREVRAV